MSYSVQVKLALTVCGILAWVYGAVNDNARVRWVGIILVAVAFLARFFQRKPTVTDESHSS